MIIRSLGRPLIVTLLAIALAAAASPVLASSVVVHFIGYTHGKADGSATLVNFNARCEASFPGVAARMCTSQDFLGSVIASTYPGVTQAWVMPSIVGAFYNSGNGSEVFVDASGVTASSPSDLSCMQWTTNSSSATGLAVQPSGSPVSQSAFFTTIPCNTIAYVACCQP